jgi:tryptophanyl-tRNA synthetase
MTNTTVHRPRVFSGVKPTGHLTLGNYLGAVRRWAETDQFRSESLFCVVDLHALTVPHDPARLNRLTRQAATLFLAAGLDPEVCTLFVQSQVAAHTRLTWIMESLATDGELRRMVQYKEKAARQRSVSTALLTYPALMAADILAYRTEEVPVGEDQEQHVELTRDLAQRFNHRYGQVFTVPRATRPRAAARVMNLLRPTEKMGKSDSDEGAIGGIVFLLDEPAAIRRKFMRAVTDSGTDVLHDPVSKPGVSNLLEILAVCTDREPAAVAEEYSSYGALKRDTAEAVIAVLLPLQKRHAELAADPGQVEQVLRRGAQRAAELAAPVVEAAYREIGLMAPVF